MFQFVKKIKNIKELKIKFFFEKSMDQNINFKMIKKGNNFDFF